MKKMIIGIVAVLAIMSLTACGNKKVENNEQNANENQEISVAQSGEKEVGTAGSNILLKDNVDEAKKQIEAAMINLLQNVYGSNIVDIKINSINVYSSEEEQEHEVLKQMNLGPNDVAFEVAYELKPAEGVETMQFTAGTGEYDEESGWVKEKYNVGVLRENSESGDQKYIITDFGTGF